jgi:3-deoxy-D-manno-octulosonate 8-phosphate phosphatase (KDO 8-P phosphatase)
MLDLFKQIDTFILDVDGVLTDGTLIVMNDGSLLRTMNIKDGYALQLAIKKNYKIIIISGGNSDVVKKRLQGLQVLEVHFAVTNKIEKLNQLIENNNLNLDTCLYMGDDMPDLLPMQKVLLPCAPQDACSEIITVAKYVSPFNGGQGCVRDVIEKVLKLKGDWE